MRRLVLSVLLALALPSTAASAPRPYHGGQFRYWWFNDNNDNRKIDAGDTILLKDTAYVDPGMEVQLLKGEKLFGYVRALPA